MSPVPGQHLVMAESMCEGTGCPCRLRRDRLPSPSRDHPPWGWRGWGWGLCLSSITLQRSVLLRTAEDGDRGGGVPRKADGR